MVTNSMVISLFIIIEMNGCQQDKRRPSGDKTVTEVLLNATCKLYFEENLAGTLKF